MAAQFERVLTAARNNRNEAFYELSSNNFPGMDCTPWRITKYGLSGGKQQGVEVVELDNGHMTVVVLPTRGMGVLEALTEELSLGWTSPVKQVVHPAYVDEESRGMLGWLEGFNEFVARCGLAYNGSPGEDTIRTNTGEKATVQLPLHGTIANTPADYVAVRVELEPPYTISVVGETHDSQMFGANFLLRTVISTVPGSAEFTISDEVQNLSGTLQEMELLYHCNYGPPMLAEGARVVAPVEYLVPRDERACEGVENWDFYGPPQDGFAEQVYFMRLFGDSSDNTVVGLVSADETRAATIRYSLDELPAFTVWKNTGAEADGYVTGLEPGTDYPNNRSFEREHNRVVEMAAGATYRASLTFGLTSGADEVARLVEEIDALAGGNGEVNTLMDGEYCPGA